MSTNVFTIDFETVALRTTLMSKTLVIFGNAITRVSDGETKVWNVKPHEKHYSLPYTEWFEYNTQEILSLGK